MPGTLQQNFTIDHEKGLIEFGHCSLSLKDDEGELCLFSDIFQKNLLSAPGNPAPITEDDKYLYVTYRALSKILIDGYFLDFTQGDVLKKSVSLMNSQTVYTNHNTDVEKWVGVVAEASWEESNPPGINAKLMIDKTENPKIAAGIKMTPPAIHSASAGVRFKYEKSHPDLPNFFFYLGEEIQGSVVRLIVTEVIGYRELSLVANGADPYAKQKSRTASTDASALSAKPTMNNLEGTDKNSGEETMQFSKAELESLGLSKSLTGKSALTKGEIDLEKEEVLGLLQAINEKLEETEKELSEIKESDSYKAGQAYLEEIRTETEKLYRLSMGEGKADESMIEEIKTASLQSLQTWKNGYSFLVNKLFPEGGENGKGTRQLSREEEPEGGNIPESAIDVDSYKMR